MPPLNRPLLILGANSFAEEVADFTAEIPGVTVAGFVENIDRARCDNLLNGKPVYWIDDLGEKARTHVFVCGLGTTRRDRYIAQAEALGCEFATLVHPTARIPASSSLGKGTILNVGVIVASHTRIGDHVCVNRGAMIGHHTQIETFSTVGPCANIAGKCQIGRGVYIGIGATIIDNLTVGPHCVIGAGAVVIESLPERVLVVGVPAKIVKRDIEGK
jgi:acetyltransferase EpsM